jgi:hypothetical protein
MTLEVANEMLMKGYPKPQKNENQKQFINKEISDFLAPFPFSDYLGKIWDTDDRYSRHGPAVLDAMNLLLSNPAKIFTNKHVTDKQINNLVQSVEELRNKIGPNEKSEILMRFAALYHDIGKSIIRERHPVIGWYIFRYIKTEDRDKLNILLQSEEDVRLLMNIIHDHDQFGVLSTGEASVPILMGAINCGESHEDRKRIISAITLCNLADLIGTFDVDGEATDRILGDWRWFMGALDYCAAQGLRIDEYLIRQASRIRSAEQSPWEVELLKEYPYIGIPNVSERVRRLLMEASRPFNTLREEFNNEQLIADCLQTVFGSENSMGEFARKFSYICKLDYGKRFFEALIQYYKENPRIGKEGVIYAAFAVLKRITITYSAMIHSGDGQGNLIGVELKDLTPENAKEKTKRIVELLIVEHYPGLTWMMSDTPAWYF